ncbi:fluoride efflux transporter CrcB [Lysobacter niabensis]|uniref:fluoride efflux transporter CrcB n=1 Tax=Agrilutibacter niabensis TaxID=380628 RepID=UPI0036117247
MNWWAFIAIGSGAALGAWARWGLGIWLNHLIPSLPMGTLVANVGGGYAIGLALAWFAVNPGVSPEMRLLLVTGFLGALTTFSTFSAESVDLLQRQQYGWAAAHALLHLAGSLLATVLGMWTMRLLKGAG